MRATKERSPVGFADGFCRRLTNKKYQVRIQRKTLTLYTRGLNMQQPTQQCNTLRITTELYPLSDCPIITGTASTCQKTSIPL